MLFLVQVQATVRLPRPTFPVSLPRNGRDRAKRLEVVVQDLQHCHQIFWSFIHSTMCHPRLLLCRQRRGEPRPACTDPLGADRRQGTLQVPVILASRIRIAITNSDALHRVWSFHHNAASGPLACIVQCDWRLGHLWRCCCCGLLAASCDVARAYWHRLVRC